MIDTATGESFVGHYRVDKADYSVLIDAMRQGRWGMRTILAVVWLSAVVLILGLSSENWTQFVAAMHDLVTLNNVPPFIYVVIIGVFLMIAFLPRITKWRALRAYSSLALADREIDLTLDETGVASTSKGRQGRTDWTEIRQVFIMPEHLVLAFSRQEAISVPKRAFASEMEFAAVTALAKRKVPAVWPK